jgi:pimeloyl-ACP methyl ester carboxylesterase
VAVAALGESMKRMVGRILGTALATVLAWSGSACAGPTGSGSAGASASTTGASPSPSVVATSTPGYVPTFVEANCAFALFDGYEPRCGYLVVPEDRADPAGRQIHLHVAIFKSTSPNPAPDPVVYLVGGPGGSAIATATPNLRKIGGAILAKRDYILFDQRGTGYSDPYLFCVPYDTYLWDARELDISLEEYNSGSLTKLTACLDDWRTRGIRIAAYDTAENAADVADLRVALGYEQVDLFGTSYGTRLALEVMRNHPAGIRSVILDSVFPPQVNLDLDVAANADRALRQVFSACEADKHCAAAYGDIEAKFYESIGRLDDKPVLIDVSGPYRNKPYKIYLDGDLLIDSIFIALYAMASLADVPRYIDAAWRGSYADLAEPAGAAIGLAVSTGTYWNTTCADEIPFETGVPEPTRLATTPALVLRKHFDPRYAVETCALWNVPSSGAAENEAVVSGIPTLLLSGSFDPITPPLWGELAARTLGRAFWYEFADSAHGVMRSSPCGLAMGLAFLDDPLHAPDSSCLQGVAAVEFK